METFEVEMRHDRASLTALSHMQYDLFCQRNRMARGFLSLTLIVIAILYGGGSWWSLLIIGYGVYLMTSTYASSNRTAHKLCEQLKAASLPFPSSRYIFEEKAMRVITLPDGEELEPLLYDKVLRLGEDRDAYYLFRDQFGGYRVPKQALGKREEEFRAYVQKKTGLNFYRRLTPLRRLRDWMSKRAGEPEHL